MTSSWRQLSAACSLTLCESPWYAYISQNHPKKTQSSTKNSLSDRCFLHLNVIAGTFLTAQRNWRPNDCAFSFHGQWGVVLFRLCMAHHMEPHTWVIQSLVISHTPTPNDPLAKTISYYMQSMTILRSIVNLFHYWYNIPWHRAKPGTRAAWEAPKLMTRLTSKDASSKRPRFLGCLLPAWVQTSLTQVPSDSGHFPRTWKPVNLHNPQHRVKFSPQHHNWRACPIRIVLYQIIIQSIVLLISQEICRTNTAPVHSSKTLSQEGFWDKCKHITMIPSKPSGGPAEIMLIKYSTLVCRKMIPNLFGAIKGSSNRKILGVSTLKENDVLDTDSCKKRKVLTKKISSVFPEDPSRA